MKLQNDASRHTLDSKLVETAGLFIEQRKDRMMDWPPFGTRPSSASFSITTRSPQNVSIVMFNENIDANRFPWEQPREMSNLTCYQNPLRVLLARGSVAHFILSV